MNIKALQDVLHAQTLPYVFPYSSFAFPTDLGFVLLAEGRRSAFFQVRAANPPTDLMLISHRRRA